MKKIVSVVLLMSISSFFLFAYADDFDELCCKWARELIKINHHLENLKDRQKDIIYIDENLLGYRQGVLERRILAHSKKDESSFIDRHKIEVGAVVSVGVVGVKRFKKVQKICTHLRSRIKMARRNRGSPNLVKNFKYTISQFTFPFFFTLAYSNLDNSVDAPSISIRQYPVQVANMTQSHS